MGEPGAQALTRRACAAEAAQRNVGGEFAGVWHEACATQRRAGGLGKGGKRIDRLHADPERGRAARAGGVEGAELAERQGYGPGDDGGEGLRGGFEAVAVGLAQEGEGQVELVVGLPAGAFDPAHGRR